MCAVHQPVPGLWIEDQCWPDMWPGASLPLGAACVEIVAIVPLPLTTPAPRPGNITHPIQPRQVPGPGNQYTRVALVTCPVTLFGTIISEFEYTDHWYGS